MRPDEAAAILRKHNAWRRDVHNESNPVLTMLNPKLVGEAIDVAVEFIAREYETTEQAV